MKDASGLATQLQPRMFYIIVLSHIVSKVAIRVSQNGLPPNNRVLDEERLLLATITSILLVGFLSIVMDMVVSFFAKIVFERIWSKRMLYPASVGILRLR